MTQPFMMGDYVKIKDTVSRWGGLKGIVIKQFGITYLVRIKGLDLEFRENELTLISTFNERSSGSD